MYNWLKDLIEIVKEVYRRGPYYEDPITGLSDIPALPMDPQTPVPVPPPHQEAPELTQTANGKKIYATAKSLLGKILAADNAADGYGIYGCAEAVNRVAFIALGREIGGGASTQLMYKALQNNVRFAPVLDPLPGDIVICPTGSSMLGAGIHGHVGITGYNDYMSNDSETATWEANYTRQSWEESFAARGFATHYFRML